MKWEIISKQNSKQIKTENILEVLLKNRKLFSEKEKQEFFNPTLPSQLSLEELGISKTQVTKAIARLKIALEKKERMVVYGDYDADGICSTAIAWETLYSLGFNVTPFIPDRFSEGYGLKKEQIKKLLQDNSDLSLIVTVDNGIVANDAVDYANSKGIDCIVTDHHEPSNKLPNASNIIHTTKTSGAGISWIFSREILKHFLPDTWQEKIENKLDLCAIGVVADQMLLTGVNRSFVKYGLESLRKTKRIGLRALFDQAAVEIADVATYHINYVIAPRINAMGRLKHGMDSLRLVCTKDAARAKELSALVAQTNIDRQKIVTESISHAKKHLENTGDTQGKVIILAHESYHEGVIGLIASKIVDEYYRPVIVFSKGEQYSKASGRSILGFNLIEAIRQLGDLWSEGGGHAMAAGFTIETDKLEEFGKRLNEIAQPALTDEILEKKIKVDLVLDFGNIDWDLVGKLTEFEPFGLGNPQAIFATLGVDIIDVKVLGNGVKHLKLKLKKDKTFDAIFFGAGELAKDLTTHDKIDIIYNLEINDWNGNKSLQLKLKDLKKHGE
ncbi:MAG: single-stranded-DNA-specific exonuclease RecJ [Patescibacteria group bacterium]